MKLDYCFHTHTKRCGHAQGEDEEYVLEAIKNGFKVVGFSDHIMYPDFDQPHVRGNFSLLQDYVDSITNLKEKYKDKIQILLGFEAEFYPNYMDYYKELFEKYHFDYMILGEHFLLQDGGGMVYACTLDAKDYIDEYLYLIEEACKTGMFTYIAHPDLFVGMFPKFNEECEGYARRVCEIAEKYQMPVEINLHGLFYHHSEHLDYPCEDFWRITKEYNLQYCIGIDAHNPNEFTKNFFEEAFAIINKYDIKLVDKDFLLKRISKIN